MTSNGKAIVSFDNEHFFLSNFYPVEIHWRDRIWPDLEHPYQAEKFARLREPWKYERVIRMIFVDSRPGHAKQVAKFHWDWLTPEQKAGWLKVRVEVMAELLALKFDVNFNPILTEKLTKTGKLPIIEGNYWHDNFWGECSCVRCRNLNIVTPAQNKLGQLLMARREAIRHE